MQYQCHLSLSKTSTDVAASEKTAIWDVPDTLLENGGGVDATTEWKFSMVDLPPMEKGSRIQIGNTRGDGIGAFGLDNIRFSTDQRCSPRYVVFICELSILAGITISF